MNWKNAGENRFLGWFRMLFVELLLSVAGAGYIFNRAFLWFELRRRLLYLFCSPWAVSRRFLDQRGEAEAQGYGETPLVTLKAVTTRLELAEIDRVLELGAGTGRNCVWLAARYGCRVDGVEQIPLMVKFARKLVQGSSLASRVKFLCGDMFALDMSGYQLVYVDCTAMNKRCIRQVAMLCAGLPDGARVVSVNASLAELMPERFQLERVFPGLFIWGWSDMRIQRVGMPEEAGKLLQADNSGKLYGNSRRLSTTNTEAGNASPAASSVQGVDQ